VNIAVQFDEIGEQHQGAFDTLDKAKFDISLRGHGDAGCFGKPHTPDLPPLCAIRQPGLLSRSQSY
jgi:hypothetical protein